jgi:uncharacterized repeat protein (TIGR01451 family)
MKKLLIALLVAALILISPAMAWGASVNVAAVDDESNTYSDRVYSQDMGYVYYSQYSQTFTTVEPGNVNAATLASYDTLFLFACNPAVFTAQQKDDIVAFIEDGGKLIIWDSEDPYPNVWDYTWLPTPFKTSVPGAMGATGTLTIVEENQLSSNDPTDPYYINAAYLSSYTDAVGDANVLTAFIPSQWCVDMEATNVLGITGPTHVYSKAIGTGLIIYCGLDWDAAGGGGSSTGALNLKKILQQELNADNLPCTVTAPTNLDVTKTADKSVYAVGDTITFTITVTNPANNPYTVEDIELVDYPPDEITLSQTTECVGDLDPGDSYTWTVTATADENGCGLENSAVATGYYQEFPVFSGGDTVTFNIGSCIPAPEFPTLAIPAGMLVGLIGFIFLLDVRRVAK